MPMFKNAHQNYIYQLYMRNLEGNNVRNSLQTAFKRGLRGDTPGYERTSLTYAAWAAGRDTRKAQLPQSDGGEWIVQENREGIQGWVELFRGEDGKLYSIPDATRFISLR